VLDAQRVYHAAELNLVQAREASLQATVALFKALGGGWQADN
jgi:multidrug efflux system outer membrane protein